MSLAMTEAQYGSFKALRSLIRQRDARERCDLCGTPLHSEHQHLFEPAARRLTCSCNACAVLFHAHGETKYKRVPTRIRYIQNFQLNDAEWDDLMIPIGVAFLVASSIEGKVLAFYPSPAGPTESTPSLIAWSTILQRNPVLNEMETDTEALLVNRLEFTRTGNCEYYLVPIDKCYELVGLIRSQWRGFSGGADVWKQVDAFFEGLKTRASWRSACA